MSRLQVGGLALVIKANNPQNLGLIVLLKETDGVDWKIESKNDEFDRSHLLGLSKHSDNWWVPAAWLLPLGDDRGIELYGLEVKVLEQSQ